MSYLLSNPKASAPLIRYVNSTGRLRPTFDRLKVDPTNNELVQVTGSLPIARRRRETGPYQRPEWSYDRSRLKQNESIIFDVRKSKDDSSQPPAP
ncbi:hypothetical protein BDR03DRAFT_1014436 [Suillus americanus]|nr:hypothetical protein BDR03DRAFT_1014436 [Suillus americanus]